MQILNPHDIKRTSALSHSFSFILFFFCMGISYFSALIIFFFLYIASVVTLKYNVIILDF